MSEPPQEALAEAFDADEVLAGLHRRLRPFALPAACLLAIYLFGVVDDWWPTPDSALYQGLARNLFRGEGYRFNGRFSNDVTPGLPVLIGAVRAVFGEGYRALNVLMTLCGLGSLVVAYLTLARWTNRGAAAAAVLGTFFCYLYFRFSHLILTDAPFALLFWLTAYACVRCLRGGWGWLAAIVPLTALAVAIRAPGALILGPLAGAVVLDRQVPAPPIRRLVVAGAVLLSAAVTIGAFYVAARLLADGTPPYLAGPATGGGLLGRFVHVAEGLWRIPGETAKVLTDRHEPRLLGLLLAVLCAIGLVVAWRRGRRLCAAVCLLNIVPSTFLIGAGCVRARYLMAFWPLLLLAILRGLLWVTERLTRWRGVSNRPAWHGRAVLGFLLGLLAVNAPPFAWKAVQPAWAGHFGRYHDAVEEGVYADLYETASFLRARLGPQARIAARWDRTRILHYLTGLSTEPLRETDRWKPEHAEAVYEDLRRRAGVDAVVTDTGKLDERYTRRLAELLEAAPDLEAAYRGRHVTVYVRRSAAGPAGKIPLHAPAQAAMQAPVAGEALRAARRLRR